MTAETLIVDLQNVAYRLYCGRAPQYSADGTSVHAATGTIDWIVGAQKALQASRVVVVDDSACDYRHRLYPEYKAGREPRPADYFGQVTLIHQYVRAIGWPLLKREGWEADDLVATVVALVPSSAIMSSDKDLRQLLSPDVCAIMREPTGFVITDHECAARKFGVPVGRIAEYLAIVGDSSDNIPGVPGAGPKMAQRLINEFGGFEAALQSLDAFSPSVQQKLLAGVESYRLSLKLTQLRRSPDITLSGLERTVVNADELASLDARHGLSLRRHFAQQHSPTQQLHLFS